MPYKDPEKRRDHQRRWRDANRDAAVEATKKWRQSEHGKQARAEYKAVKKAELRADKHHKWHGTISGYGMGCRCTRCVEAASAYRKQRTYSTGSLTPRQADQ